MDLGVGALIAVGLAKVFGLLPNSIFWSIGLLLVGAILGILPDLDIAFRAMRGHRIDDNHHKTLWHRPLWVLPPVALLGIVVGGMFGHPYFGGTLAFVCVLYHYLHDTPDGIAWFWPVVDRCFAPKGFFDWSETPMEQPGNYDRWTNALLTPSPRYAAEILVAGVSMAFAINIATRSYVVGTFLSTLGGLCATAVWITWNRNKRKKS